MSRRTDILAFHSGWFNNCLRNGFVAVANPFNQNQRKIVSLKKKDVTAFVFWTRNPLPSLDLLESLERNGIPFYVMVTFTNYPGLLEKNVPDLDSALDIFSRLSSLIGAGKVVLRYDPVLLSNFTGIDFHLKNFKEICEKFSPFTKKVITSLFDPYDFVVRRMGKISDLRLSENYEADAAKLLAYMKSTADEHSLDLQSCCEAGLFENAGISKGACIDVNLLNGLFGLNLKHEKDNSQRKNCLCSKSVDIGSYNTCPAGCAYCYANR